MKPLQSNSPLAMITLLLLLFSPEVEADDCQPWTWNAKKRGLAVETGIPRDGARISKRSVEPGEVNCRNWGNTYEDVNYYTCMELANRYGITIEMFFVLNPTLDPDCDNIESDSKYCVDGCKL
jgi:hypothetical protein